MTDTDPVREAFETGTRAIGAKISDQIYESPAFLRGAPPLA